MDNDKRMQEISDVQAQHIDELMAYPHVVGVGIGMRQKDGEFTDEMCLVVMVDEKLPVAQLANEDVLPNELDGVTIDVQETGSFTA
jgi:hypothetical protein